MRSYSRVTAKVALTRAAATWTKDEIIEHRNDDRSPGGKGEPPSDKPQAVDDGKVIVIADFLWVGDATARALQYVGSCLYMPTKRTTPRDASRSRPSTPRPRPGLVRSRDLVAAGTTRVALSRLVQQGALLRVGRGIYTRPDFSPTEHHGLAVAAAQVPSAVVCLLSALQFHRLTTQAPFEVWLAVGGKARKPTLGDSAVRIVRFSARALTEGVEVHQIEGVPVRVTSIARTVADCFKYRNKIGLDVALEALKEYRRSRRSIDDLVRAARIVRVENVMRPYLEAVTA
jgi:hypothetical protein